MSPRPRPRDDQPAVGDRQREVDRGAITLSGTAAELKADPRVQDIYLGVSRGS